MAGRLILGVANPALDADGVVDAGSTMTFWEADTTTLQSIYAEEALETPLANPLSPDSAGRFPMIWAASGTSYDVKWTPTGATPIVYSHIKPVTDFDSDGGIFHIECTIDGAGSVPSTGICGDTRVAFACEIIDASVQAIGTGSVEVDVWVADFVPNTPPTVSNSIVASAPITLDSAQSSLDQDLTGWTTAVPANSAIRFNVNSIDTITHFTVIMTARRTA